MLSPNTFKALVTFAAIAVSSARAAPAAAPASDSITTGSVTDIIAAMAETHPLIKGRQTGVNEGCVEMCEHIQFGGECWTLCTNDNQCGKSKHTITRA